MTEVTQILILTAFFLAFGIAAILLAPVKNRAVVSIFVVLINAILTSIPALWALAGKYQSGTLQLYHFPGDAIHIRIDNLSAWFILIINFTSINGALFGSGYLKSYNHLKTNISVHWIFYVLFHISMVWVCMFDHGIMFLISWELMSLSSLLLVIFEYQNTKVLKAGLNYLVQMHLSVLFLTVGFIWLFAETGSFDLSSLMDVVSQKHSIWIFSVFFVGFAIKAGFLPFHTWLPHAHPAAPSHVSGVMSGVIVKLGIYGIFRIISYLNHDWLIIGEILLSLSVITAIYGIVNAAVKYDFKRKSGILHHRKHRNNWHGPGLGSDWIGKTNGGFGFPGFCRSTTAYTQPFFVQIPAVLQRRKRVSTNAHPEH
ncbi:MAG: proton-conducting transporter membrane subunit [Cyclobacteriaceae bacterium]|nr:proton-conducting transporter membrane subunit [Cyclobacteriaceae bacterium]